MSGGDKSGTGQLTCSVMFQYQQHASVTMLHMFVNMVGGHIPKYISQSKTLLNSKIVNTRFFHQFALTNTWIIMSST